MSSLSAFAAHARAMATAEHKPECEGERECVYARLVPKCSHCPDRCRSLGAAPHPNPACPGCVTDADRALWARLADEAEAYLSRHEEASLL